MRDGARTERLLVLLRAQRTEVATRARLVRGSGDWRVATDRLDDLNERIMQPEPGPDPLELGLGVALDLDSRPAQDASFRTRVVECVRDAFLGAARDRLAVQILGQLAGSEDPIGIARAILVQAQVRLRGDYPGATVSALAIEARPPVIIVRADRHGRVA